MLLAGDWGKRPLGNKTDVMKFAGGAPRAYPDFQQHYPVQQYPAPGGGAQEAWGAPAFVSFRVYLPLASWAILGCRMRVCSASTECFVLCVGVCTHAWNWGDRSGKDDLQDMPASQGHTA